MFIKDACLLWAYFQVVGFFTPERQELHCAMI